MLTRAQQITMKRAQAQAGLSRVSRSSLEISGLRCGIQKPWEKSPCGGELLVKDWHPQEVRGDSRYEIYCDSCGTCDPNGWARQDEIIPAARKHFSALEVPC